MTQVAEQQDTFASAFEAFRRTPAFGTGSGAAARTAAFERFRSRGWPTARDEEWKFTNVAPIAKGHFDRSVTDPSGASPSSPGVPEESLARLSFGSALPHRIVIVNGRLAKSGALESRVPHGVTLRLVHDELLAPARPAGTNVFADLNTAFAPETILLEVAPKTVVVEPLHLLVVSTARDGVDVMASPHLIIKAGSQAQVSIVESHASTGSAFTNAVTEFVLEPGAMVDHVKFQRDAASAFHIANMIATLGRGSTLRSHSISLGGRIIRNDIHAVLDGEGAECTLNGLYIADGDSLVDNHTSIDHAQPHCPSHEVYKGILAGRARAVFNGKIVVRQDAQKTNAKQTNKALLLTDDASINTKPQLEIFADDVKCTHGAAIGQLDEDALFYLRARGIGLTEARNIMIHAFAGEVLDGVAIEAVRHEAMRVVEEKLAI